MRDSRFTTSWVLTHRPIWGDWSQSMQMTPPCLKICVQYSSRLHPHTPRSLECAETRSSHPSETFQLLPPNFSFISLSSSMTLSPSLTYICKFFVALPKNLRGKHRVTAAMAVCDDRNEVKCELAELARSKTNKKKSSQREDTRKGVRKRDIFQL